MKTPAGIIGTAAVAGVEIEDITAAAGAKGTSNGSLAVLAVAKVLANRAEEVDGANAVAAADGVEVPGTEGNGEATTVLNPNGRADEGGITPMRTMIK